MAIVKQSLLDCPGNDEKMTSHSNFNLKFSKRLLVVVRSFSFRTFSFLFQFGVIWEVSWSGVII